MKKENVIKAIQNIIVDCGEIKYPDVRGESAIIISTVGHSVEYVDSIDLNGISTVISVDGHIIDYDYHIFEYLTESLLGEINDICEEYQTQCDKTMKRSQ